MTQTSEFEQAVIARLQSLPSLKQQASQAEGHAINAVDQGTRGENDRNAKSRSEAHAAWNDDEVS